MTFTMWSAFHYLFIASPFIFAAILFFALKNLSAEGKRLWGIILSVIAILLLIARNVEILNNHDWKMQPEVIPLQICHFANFVLLFAFWFRSKTMFALAFCLNLPAALMSIIFADSLTNYRNVLTARGIAYLAGHMLIVGITLWALLAGFIRMDRKVFLRTALTMLGLYLGSVVINNLFNAWMPDYKSNYFYALAPENGTPLEIFFKLGKEIKFLGLTFNPVYLLLTMLLGIVIVLAFYGLYKLYEKYAAPKLAKYAV